MKDGWVQLGKEKWKGYFKQRKIDKKVEIMIVRKFESSEVSDDEKLVRFIIKGFLWNVRSMCFIQ